mgnify:CR=1 FL=1
MEEQTQTPLTNIETPEILNNLIVSDYDKLLAEYNEHKDLSNRAIKELMTDKSNLMKNAKINIDRIKELSIERNGYKKEDETNFTQALQAEQEKCKRYETEMHRFCKLYCDSNRDYTALYQKNSVLEFNYETLNKLEEDNKNRFLNAVNEEKEIVRKQRERHNQLQTKYTELCHKYDDLMKLPNGDFILKNEELTDRIIELQDQDREHMKSIKRLMKQERQIKKENKKLKLQNSLLTSELSKAKEREEIINKEKQLKQEEEDRMPTELIDQLIKLYPRYYRNEFNSLLKTINGPTSDLYDKATVRLQDVEVAIRIIDESRSLTIQETHDTPNLYLDFVNRKLCNIRAYYHKEQSALRNIKGTLEYSNFQYLNKVINNDETK